MEIADAVDRFHQYVLVEKGLSPQTWVSYLDDLEAFFQYFKNKSTTEHLLESDALHDLRSAHWP